MRFPLVVIPASGHGTRMGEAALRTPKCLMEVRGEPIIRHVVRFWAQYADEIVVVTRPQDADAFADVLGADINAIVRDQLCDGVNNAVLAGLRAVGCPERFAVGLGDCLFEGAFDFQRLGTERMGVGVMEAGDFSSNYAVGRDDLQPHTVAGTIEKPLMGLGAYFLGWEAVHFLATMMEITGAVHELAQNYPVQIVPFDGRYLNVNTPEDLERW